MRKIEHTTEYKRGAYQRSDKTFLLFTWITILYFSCNPGTSKPLPDDSAHNASYTDSNLKTIPPGATKLVDPDSSDNEPATDYPPDSFGTLTEEKIRKQLSKFYKKELDQNIITHDNRKFFFLEYDLNGDSEKEILVGLTGSYFCNSEGCTVLLLNGAGTVTNHFAAIKFPILISDKKTSGWNDLIIESAGKYHVLRYAGKKYPENLNGQPVQEVPATNGFMKALNIFNEPYPKFSF